MNIKTMTYIFCLFLCVFLYSSILLGVGYKKGLDRKVVEVTEYECLNWYLRVFPMKRKGDKA